MPSGQEITWTCVALLEPFSWTVPQDRSRSARPQHCRAHLERITQDRREHLAWRVTLGQVLLRELGRENEATSPGPRWPLVNVDIE